MQYNWAVCLLSNFVEGKKKFGQCCAHTRNIRSVFYYMICFYLASCLTAFKLFNFNENVSYFLNLKKSTF